MFLLLMIIILIIPAVAQLKVTTSYNKYRNMDSEKGLTGQEVARNILDEHGLQNVYVVETNGTLTDHYDPSRKVVRLSQDIYRGTSIASAAVAAHECGHAIQDQEGYAFMRFRSVIFPVVRICTSLSYFIILIGIIAEAFNVIHLGIAFVGTGLVFQIVTLPVEFDASRRGENELTKLSLISPLEEMDAKNMLDAAAQTYVAGVLSSALELLRLILIFGGSDRR